jgi:hypothetical protein
LSLAARLLYLIVTDASASVVCVQAAFNPKTGDEPQLLEPR